VETLKRVAKSFLVGACIGMAVGVVAACLAQAITTYKLHHLDFIGGFLLLLAPGLIAGLGMPPFLDLLLTVLVVNFVLYGAIGLVVGVIRSLIGAGGAPASRVDSRKADG
jgi:hypothetical protein